MKTTRKIKIETAPATATHKEYNYIVITTTGKGYTINWSKQ